MVTGIGKNSGECSSESKENAKNRGAKAKQTSGVPRIDSSGTNCHTTLVPRQTSLLRYKVYILDTRKWKSPAIYQAKARRRQGFASDSQIGFCLIPGSSLSITSTSCARPLHGPPLRMPVRPSYKCVWLPGPGTAPDLPALVISMQTPR